MLTNGLAACAVANIDNCTFCTSSNVKFAVNLLESNAKNIKRSIPIGGYDLIYIVGCSLLMIFIILICIPNTFLKSSKSLAVFPKTIRFNLVLG